MCEKQDYKVAISPSVSQSEYCYLSCTCLYMAILSAHTVCATVESLFVFWVALRADERCVCVHALSISGCFSFQSFSGCNLESQLSPHPTLTHKYMHTHTLGCGISILLHDPGSLRP